MAPSTKTIREVKYRIQKVEVPVVPEIKVYIDGDTLLNLVKDRKLSSSSTLVLRTDGSQAMVRTAGASVDSSDNSQTNSGPQSIEDIKKNLMTSRSADEQEQSDDSTSAEESSRGMSTENRAARLRYDLGCRYMSTSRYDMAVKEFVQAFNLDNDYNAPLLKLREIAEITGRDIVIPEKKAEETHEPSGTNNTVNVTVNNNSVTSSTATTTTTVTSTSENNEGDSSTPLSSENSQGGSSQSSGSGDSILFTGLTIAVILVIIKLVFLDETRNQ